MRCGPGHTGCFISKCKTTTIQNINKTKGRGVKPKCVMHYFKSKKYTIHTKTQKLKKKLQRLRPKGMWWRWKGVALWRPAKIGKRGKQFSRQLPADYSCIERLNFTHTTGSNARLWTARVEPSCSIATATDLAATRTGTRRDLQEDLLLVEFDRWRWFSWL